MKTLEKSRLQVTTTIASDNYINAYSSYFDFDTGKRFNVGLENHAIIIYDAIALTNKRILACGIDQAFKTVALYYDGDTWKSTKLNDDIMAKCITNTSYAINSSYSENGNVWFYPDEKYTGNNNELRTLVLRRPIKHR